MDSPFYISEQKRLYPNRSTANTVKAVAKRMRELVSKKITTQDKLLNMPTGEVKLHYFPSATVWTILDAFSENANYSK